MGKRKLVLPFDAVEHLEAAIDRRLEEAERHRFSISFLLSIERMWEQIRNVVDLVDKADQDFHRTLTDGVDRELADRYWNGDRPAIVARMKGVVARYKELIRTYVFLGPETRREKDGAIEFYRPHRGDLDSMAVDAQLDRQAAGRMEHGGEAVLHLMQLMGRDACRCGHIRREHEAWNRQQPHGCTRCKCKIFLGTDDLSHLL